MYMTFTLIEVMSEGRLAAVGRHLPLLVYRAASRSVEEIETGGVWLGIMPELGAELVPTTELTLEAGDSLLLYTDGVLEHAVDDRMFGLERLKDLLRTDAARGPEALLDSAFTALERHSSLQQDDMTMLVYARI
jgi:sigma-B regulation protein RsbU (phosphoserine phosphatase)